MLSITPLLRVILKCVCRDRRKLTFYFVAEKRIDFRELVRELFRYVNVVLGLQPFSHGACL